MSLEDLIRLCEAGKLDDTTRNAMLVELDREAKAAFAEFMRLNKEIDDRMK